MHTASSQPTPLGLCWYEEARPSQCLALDRLDRGLKFLQHPGNGRSSLSSVASNIHLSTHCTLLPTQPSICPSIIYSSIHIPIIYAFILPASIHPSHHAFVYSSSTHLSTHTSSTHYPSMLHPFTHNPPPIIPIIYHLSISLSTHHLHNCASSIHYLSSIHPLSTHSCIHPIPIYPPSFICLSTHPFLHQQ